MGGSFVLVIKCLPVAILDSVAHIKPALFERSSAPCNGDGFGDNVAVPVPVTRADQEAHNFAAANSFTHTTFNTAGTQQASPARKLCSERGSRTRHRFCYARPSHSGLAAVFLAPKGLYLSCWPGVPLKPDSLLLKHVLHLLLTCDHGAALTLVTFSFRVKLAG